MKYIGMNVKIGMVIVLFQHIFIALTDELSVRSSFAEGIVQFASISPSPRAHTHRRERDGEREETAPRCIGNEQRR